MNIAPSVFRWLLVAGFGGSTALGAGFTYLDLTVSPFAPEFFGIGHVDPYRGSEANGVAAQGGVFYGTVGIVNAPSVSGAPTYEAIFSRRSSPFYLPGPGGPPTSSVVWAITPDGKIMVGSSGGGELGGPAVWNAAFERRQLPNPGGGYGYSADLLAVSADGTAAVGYGTNVDRQQGARWPLDGSPPTLLGLIDGYDSTLAQGISADGGVICGRAFNTAEAIRNGAPDRMLALRKAFTSPWQVLEPLAGYTDSVAFGVVNDVGGFFTVGQSFNRATGGSTACFWGSGAEAHKLPAFDLRNTYESAAYAVSSSVTPLTIVGEMGRVGEMEAVAWKGASIPDRISGLLSYPYRVPVGKWRLTRATGVSADRYTICGVGVNPEGQIEGWVAILPPILYPPLIDPIPPQRAELDKPFFFGLTGGRLSLAVRFSAKNLPDGFQIDSVTGTITGTWDITKAHPGDYTVTVYAAEPTQGTTDRSFTLTLPPPSSVEQIINGLGFLPYAKPPGETYFPTSFGFGLSGNGQVAIGYSGPNNDPRAFRWSAEAGMTPLPIVEGALYGYSNAYAASADGRVIVGEATAAATENGPGNRVAVRWNAAGATSSFSGSTRSPAEPATASSFTITSLGFIPPNGTSSVANDVSADGTVIVGYGSDYNPKVKGSGIRQAFRWTATEGMVGLGWLPGGFLDSSTALAVSADGSVVVGGSSSANGSEAFRWTAAGGMKGLGLPSGASFGRATGISGDNSTIIGHNGFSNHNHAFRWTAAEGMTDLGFLPGDNVSEANDISADGSVIVGRCAVDFNPSRAFIWDKTNGMRDLKAVLVAGNSNLAGWTLRDALSISADGKTITGWGKNPNGDLEAYAGVLEVRPAQPLNISTRMRVLTGDKVLIGGFIITGTEAKKVIIRGIGPSLANFGLQGVMADPTLELHQGSPTIAMNDNWKENQAEVETTGLPPSNELESAIVATLAPGAYTAILADKLNRPGLGLVEVYDLAQTANSKLANISTRGFVDTGDNAMIGGFIVGGGSIGGNARVIVRAIGASLIGFGISGALEDTTLEMYDGNGRSLATNDNWKIRSDGTSQQAEIEATNLPPQDDRESAIVSTLTPGNYTAIVRGKSNTTGIALVEAYNLQ